MQDDEAGAKLGSSVQIDVLRPLQAYDAGGRARAFAGLIQSLAQAKEAGIDPETVLGTGMGWFFCGLTDAQDNLPGELPPDVLAAMHGLVRAVLRAQER